MGTALLYKIWHDQNTLGARWFLEGASLTKRRCKILQIPNPGTASYMNLSEQFKKIIRLDKPDLIMTIAKDGVDIPVVSVEISATTPQSQHAKQRVNRLAAAAEADFPAIYIIPGRKKSGGSYYRLGDDLYLGLNRIREINSVPVFIYRYPDNNGILIHDSRFPNQPNLVDNEIRDCFHTIKTIIKYKAAGKDTNQVLGSTWIKREIDRHNRIASGVRMNIDNYATLEEIDTSDLQAYLQANTKMSKKRIIDTSNILPDRIRNRDKTLIFRPRGRMFQHAGDPYCGMLAFFDYVFCRTGRGVEDRSKNLVYMPLGDNVSSIMHEFCPAGYHRFWQDKCPFKSNRVPTVMEQLQISHHLQYGCVFTKIKPLRIFGYFSDMIVFQDSILVF